MPIAVKCGGCSHEMTVADSMAGKKGRCPECDAVLSIPGSTRSARRGGIGGSSESAQTSEMKSYGKLSFLSGMMSILGLISLLGFAGVGVYTGVVAVRFPGNFVCPFGVFDCLAASVAAQPILMGLAFAVGGLLFGSLCFLVLNAAGQAFLMFIAIEKSLRDIAQGLADRGE